MGTSIFYTYDANNLINANITTNSGSDGLKSVTIIKPQNTITNTNRQVDLYTSIIPFRYPIFRIFR